MADDNDEQVYVGASKRWFERFDESRWCDAEQRNEDPLTPPTMRSRQRVNSILPDARAASGYSVVPSICAFARAGSLLASRKVSEAGNQSPLTYLAVNTIAFHQNGVRWKPKRVKWLKGRGVGGKDRMVATPTIRNTSAIHCPLQSVPRSVSWSVPHR